MSVGNRSCSKAPPRGDHRVLDDPYRRCAVEVLLRKDGRVPLATAVDAVARAMCTADSDRVALSLHHLHLPKLDDAGFVDYDADARTVAATDRGAAAQQHVALVSYYQ